MGQSSQCRRQIGTGDVGQSRPLYSVGLFEMAYQLERVGLPVDLHFENVGVDSFADILQKLNVLWPLEVEGL